MFVILQVSATQQYPIVTFVSKLMFAGHNEIFSLEETSTCEYEVLVLTPLLCKHPDYRAESAQEKEIKCVPLNPPSSAAVTTSVAAPATASPKHAPARRFGGNLVDLEVEAFDVDGSLLEVGRNSLISGYADHNFL